MADTTILAAGVAGVPESYTVPATAVITPKSVNAVLDGTGASGSFVATLEVLNDAGIVVARSPVSTTTAAGGSAEVSWFPFVDGGGGAASATNYMFVSYDSAAGLSSSSSLTSLNLDPSTSPVSWGTNAPTVFDLQDNGAGIFGPTLLANGLFVFSCWALIPFNVSPAAGKIGQIGVTGSNQSIGGNDSELIVATLAGTAWGAEPSRLAIWNMPAAYGTPPITAIVQVGQNSTHTSQTFTMDFYMWQIDSAGNTNF